MELNFDEILLELGYRVPEGIVDLTKEHQVTELVNILKENGYTDANELAQKARVYFSYLKEIDEAGRKSNTGPETLVVNKKSGAVYPVKKFNTKTQTKASKKDIEKAKATGKFGTQPPKKGVQKTAPAADIRVSDAEKNKQKKVEPVQKANITLNDKQKSIKDSLNAGNLNALKTLSAELAKERDKGFGGAGGAVPSYGENRLTTFSNDLSSVGGFEGFVSENADAVQQKMTEVSKNKILINNISDVSKFLGLNPSDDNQRTQMIMYIAAREVFCDQELQRIKADKKSLYYKTGKEGFGRNDQAVRDWGVATFDGAMATNHLIQNSSNIDTSKPFIVLQADPKEGRHDDAIKAHLQDKINSSSGKDKQHYESELETFKHLGFHDTYALGQDKGGRTTIFSISNKKLNDLSDIWGNTTPAYMLKLLSKDFPPNVSKNVVKAVEDGIQLASDVNKSTIKMFTELKIDKEFVNIVDSDLKKYINTARTNQGFNKWLEENGYTADKDTTELLKQLQAYGKTGKASYEITGKLVTKVGEIALKRGMKPAGTVGASIERKQAEKETARAIHESVTKAYTNADKKLGYPKNGINGPHTKAFVKTTLDSMHINYMIENYDGKLGIVTGGTGSTPADFRNGIAKLLGFKGDVKDTKQREKLYKLVVSKAQLDPDTRGIIIKTPNQKFELAQASWRTAGTTAKVQHKLGVHLRKMVQFFVSKRNEKTQVI